MGTFVVLTVLILVIAFIVRGMIKDKKEGRSVICGGECKHCGGHCTHKNI